MSKAEAYVNHGVSCFLKGFIDEAERHLINGANYCQKIDYVSGFLANQYLGMIYLEKKQYRESQGCFAKAILILDNRGAGNSMIHFKLDSINTH